MLEYFGLTSGLHTKLFYNIKSNDFFLSRRRFALLTTVTSVSEMIVIFLQLILHANTVALFCSILGLISHSFVEEVSTSKRLIPHPILAR